MRRCRARNLIATAVLLVVSVFSAPATAQSSAAEAVPSMAPAAGDPVAAPADSSGPSDSKAAEDLEKKRKVRVAAIIGGLIAVTGLALVALTILGGSATRRSLRRKPISEGPAPAEPIPAERFDDVDPAEDSAAPGPGKSP